MSEIDQAFERKMKEMKGFGAPTLQRIYWIIASIVGAITVFSFLLPYLGVIQFELLQLILISFVVALIIAIIAFSPKTGDVDWSKLLSQLSELRIIADRMMVKLQFTIERVKPTVDVHKPVLVVIEAIKIYIVAIRTVYRLAIVEEKTDLANDFQKEIDELGGWIDTVEKYVITSKK